MKCHAAITLNILIYLIWSTKDRHPWLTPGIREKKTHALLAGAVRQMDCEAYRVGGVAGHVHLAVRPFFKTHSFRHLRPRGNAVRELPVWK